MHFPAPSTQPAPVTRLILDQQSSERLPIVRWAGAAGDELDEADGLIDLLGPRRGVPTLIEQTHGSYGRPGLRGHRLAASPGTARDVAGRAWSTRFETENIEASDRLLTVTARDKTAALSLRTEIESLPGGALRARHILTNDDEMPYLLEGLEISLPLPAGTTEILDFTGRHEGERAPQRHHITDGIWLRESRRGKTGHDAASVLAAGTAGFSFSSGELMTATLGHSGNSVLAVQRNEASDATLSVGELLLPGEVVLLEGDSYTMPWVYFAASRTGLDSAAQALHTWQRTLPAHPQKQPVTLNVWEAVYFDHDAEHLERLADLAGQVGVERFVLDDGWFHGRRNDTAGLGDWWVDETTWPNGLGRLIDHVHRLGMTFGLWFEPEMVNPDSNLYREHPDWILATAGREPLQHRNQHVLDLSNPAVWQYLIERIDQILSQHAVDYVKWDHNRDLLDAGSAAHDGAPAVHAQNAAFYALLDELRTRHPHLTWESCAGGGGRIDLGVMERVQRFWTSDMTDALARQHIQRWTSQLIAPEYLGAHISAPISHQTGRALSLNFRAATAFFLAFGIEWDLTEATEAELEALAAWVTLHKEHRPLLHSGHAIRIDVTDPAALAHGVIAEDRHEAVLCYVQLDEAVHNRGCTLRVPGLRPDALYQLRWLGPIDREPTSMSPGLSPRGPTNGAVVTGRQLADIGVWIPRRRPQTANLMHILTATADERTPRANFPK